MEPLNARSMLDAAAAAAVTAKVTAAPDRPPVERRRRLSQAALAVTNQKVQHAYSPIVIAGAVRVADFVLLSLIGIAIYFLYVVPLSGFYWEYVGAILGMTAAAVKMTVLRLRERLRELIRCEAGETVDTPEAVEDEIRHLFAAFSRAG